jgi:tetratricopeptide (TPR) repeat protein
MQDESLNSKHPLASTTWLAGIFACVLFSALAVSGVGGYFAGQDERYLRATQTTVFEMDAQSTLGVQNIAQGQYALAVQRLRWVLERRPDYPGAADALQQAETKNAGDVPTLLPPDPNNPAAIFDEARQYFDAKEWAHAIARLQDLQVIAPDHRPDEVREMLYDALVTLGLEYVRADRLQEGLSLLDQAAAIKPLDDQAAGERRLATLYVTGRSYWNLNWVVVIQNFKAIYAVAPNYYDVQERLPKAYIAYADQLVALGAQCDAAENYKAGLQIKPDAEVKLRLSAATLACSQPTSTPLGTPVSGGGSPTPTPTPTPTAGTLPPATP